MKRWKRIVPLILILTALVLPFNALVAEAQIQEPDAGFEILQCEVYRDIIAEDAQLYLITAQMKYNTVPAVYNVSEAFIVTLRDVDNITLLGTSTFYNYGPNSGFSMQLCSIQFDAASAPTWNLAYNIHIDGNPSLHWLNTTAEHAMSGVWYYDHSAGTYLDETVAANDAVASDVSIPPDALVGPENDALYLGSTGMFNLVTVNVGTNGNWNGQYAWEYWDGDEWMAVDGLNDGTAGFTGGTGMLNVAYDCPTDWQQNPVNGATLYWLRFRIVTSTAWVAQPFGSQFWTNTLDDPPHIETDVFSVWYDGGSVSATRDRLTIRLRSIAQSIENDWGGPPAFDLLENILGVNKLTPMGEEYFENVIDRLREICPDLFADVTTTPDFGENAVVSDSFMGGDDNEQGAFAANWYAQTYTATSSYDMVGVWVKAFTAGLPGDLTVGLTASAADLPTGPILASGVTDADVFTTSTVGDWYLVTFTTEQAITSGTVYAVVFYAAGGGATDNVSWRSDVNGGYTGGQGSASAGGLAGPWAAIPPVPPAINVEDFLFSVMADEAYSFSYRDRLGQKLVGSRFDAVWALDFGMTRMWGNFLTFMFVALCIVVAFGRAIGDYKYSWLVLFFLFPFGAWFGYIYLELAILLAFCMMALCIYIFAYRASP